MHVHERTAAMLRLDAGGADEWQRTARRSVGADHGLRNGYRGRFGMYLPPLLEELRLVELEHNARNNRARAVQHD